MLKLIRSLMLLVMWGLIMPVAEAATLEVGPGKTYTTIMAAITASRNRDVILVSSGIYTEDVDFSGKSVTLKSVSGPTSTTIIGSSAAIYMHSNETTDAKVEGFTLRSGSAYVTLVAGADPTFTNVVLTQAASSYVMYFSDSKATLNNITVTNNNSSYGILATDVSHVKINTSTFSNNSGSYGTALYVQPGSSMEVVNSIFENNQATGYGGAIYASGAAMLTIDNSKFYGNKASYGGAIYLTDIVLSPVRISGCHIANNEATYGAGIHTYNSTLHANDNAFADNVANGGQGGAIYINAYGATALLNNTFVLNDASDGGAIYQYTSSDLLLVQNIFSQSTSGYAIYAVDSNARSSAWYNLFYDNYPADMPEEMDNWVGTDGNISGDPLLTGFVDDRNPKNDTFMVASGSPAIDAGSPLWQDSDGTSADIGVGGADDLARPVAGDRVVAPQGGSGVYTTITEAIAAASNGQKIVVYPGAYGGSYNFNGKNVAIVSAYGPELTLMSGSDPVLQYDDAEDNRSQVDGFTIWNRSTSYAVYVIDASPVLTHNHFRKIAGSYVTYVQGGNTTFSGSRFEDNTASYVQYFTGGVHTLGDNSYANNRVSAGGGFTAVSGAQIRVNNSRFSGNVASGGYGGAIYAPSPQSLAIDECTFNNNKATYGGAIFLQSSVEMSRISTSKFAGNEGTYGGALYHSYGSLYFNDNSVADNTASDGGGVYLHTSASTSVFNNTFASNSAQHGGGVYAYSGSNTLLLQNILFKTSGGNAVETSDPTARLLAWYNLFNENSPSDFNTRNQIGVRGNLHTDPRVTGYSDDNNPNNDTFTVASNSPAVNGGSGDFKDADGTVADIGVGGSDDAARPVTGTRVVAAVGTATYRNVGDAVEAAGQGDKVVVYPGVWPGELDPKGKNIQIVGAYGPEETVLAGSNVAMTYTTHEDSRSVLDGFTIWTAGGSYGIYTYLASPIFRNLHFRFVLSSSYSTYHDHGTLSFTNCTWEGNSGSYNVYLNGSEAIFTTCTWRDNHISYGGAISLVSGAVANISQSIIEENTASAYGGAVYMAGGDGISIDGSSLLRNTASYGGAIYLESGLGISRLSNNLIALNEATYGGGIYNYGTTLYANDNRIIENDATAGQGGGYFLNSASSTVIMNNTIVGNAASQGGGIYLYAASDTLLGNSIVAFQTDGEGVYQYDPSARLTAAHNDVFDNYDPNYAGTLLDQTGQRGNLSVDPKFISYSADGNLSNDNLKLAPFSSLVNAGIKTFKDSDGSVSDLGWGGGDDTKRESGYTLSVSPYGGTDYGSIQDAVDQAKNGDTIAVYPGMYSGDLDFSGKDVQIVGIRGAYTTGIAGTSYGIRLDSGEGAGSFKSTLKGFTVHSAGSYGIYVVSSKLNLEDSTLRVMRSSYSAYVYDGTLNLTRCTVEDNNNSYSLYYTTGSTGTITQSTIQNNTSGGYGAGLHVTGESDVDVVQSYFVGNNASSGSGGGIGVYGTSVLDVRDSVFSRNRAGYGAGLYLESSVATLAGTLMDRNTASVAGGAVYAYATNGTFKNNILMANSSPDGAGVYLTTGSSHQWINNDLLEGESTGQGGGFHVANGATLYSINNIIAHQTDGEGIYLASGSNYDIRYNDVYQNYNGPIAGTINQLPVSNLTGDPKFVSYTVDSNPGNDDLHLANGSPCIDGGDPTLSDKAGGRSDIGAYGGEGFPALDADGDTYTVSQGDCDDNDATIYPGAPELDDGKDNDCNGAGDEPFTDQDGDGYSFEEGDCDDANPSIKPGAVETCDTRDNDCDGLTDEGIGSTFYKDSDGDGYGTTASTTVACTKPTGYSSTFGDCNDNNSAVSPGKAEVCDGLDNNCDGQIDEQGGTTWYKDSDGDTYGTSISTLVACTKPTGYVSSSGDCNDSDITINPTATEVCNGVDDDCDGTRDDGFDKDQDGVPTCSLGDSPADCNDNNANVSPTRTETCDGIDNNCNGQTDEQVDADGDGVTGCAGDCDDNNSSVKPGATEVCDGVDNNCNTTIDEGFDKDGDTYKSCTSGGRPADCNDNNASINPGKTEICNGTDDNCNGTVDENLTTTYCADMDGDDFGDPDSTAALCVPNEDYVANCTDLNDSDDTIYPGAPELPDGNDNDGDGDIDEGTDVSDDDGDGYSEADGDCDDHNVNTSPGEDEYNDGSDNNCNGQIDDGVSTTDQDGDGLSPAEGDCNDDNDTSSPGSSEVSDGVDNDCDGIIDEGTDSYDDDGDGISEDEGDCDDNDIHVGAGTSEYTDGQDNNCDSQIDNNPDTIDNDGDGVSEQQGDCDDTRPDVAPGEVETQDGTDNNCDGTVDEAPNTSDLDGDSYTVAEGDCDDTDADINPGEDEVAGNNTDDNCNGLVDEVVDETPTETPDNTPTEAPTATEAETPESTPEPTGTPDPTPEVTPGEGVVEVSEETLDFGGVQIGDEITLFITITNKTPEAVLINSLDITQQENGFSLVDDSNATLQPGNSYKLYVEFAPQSAGEFTGTLHFLVDESDRREVQLSGSGVGADTVEEPTTPEVTDAPVTSTPEVTGTPPVISDDDGCGCTSQGDTFTPVGALLLGLTTLLLRRRHA